MFNKTMVWTTVVAALFTTGALKFLHFFNFISWSPVGWGRKWLWFGSSEEGWKWAVLFIILLLVFGLFYVASSAAANIPPAVMALTISIIATVAIEWIIYTPDTLTEGLKKLSIPFFSILAIVSRFVTGTAIYMKKTFG
ncbi:hypothetical protein MHZ92_13505 [Sporosarcina sp. ACRSL]|uniref:hypothetical protein n=1 Tax=Sporosarcina sp. ACRSL TaxID=2918215 RepID=UPI001EF7102C|nr:hypothetical protein [Sporosarcina sp. ACRSL]MCG7345155.1 hypothetical protein [Sporosarcina sp. ACRSL]